MALDNAGVGVNNVPSYQMSGVPYVVSGSATSGSVSQISFPFVTRDLYIRSRASSCVFGFSASGTNGSNGFTLQANESVTLQIRTGKLFVKTVTVASGTYEIVAGLTGIPGEQFPTLTASNGFLGVG